MNGPRPSHPGTFQVLIDRDSSARINHAPLPRRAQFVETTVLDELHQHALAHGTAVDAIVVDHRYEWTLTVRVEPSGESDIVDGPRELSTTNTTVHLAGADAPPMPVRQPTKPQFTQWGREVSPDGADNAAAAW